MTLQELWEKLTHDVDASLSAAISYFSPQVRSLSDELPDYEHHEYPKWVNGQLVQSAVEDPTVAKSEPAETPAQAAAPAAPKLAGT